MKVMIFTSRRGIMISNSEEGYVIIYPELNRRDIESHILDRVY
jgi:hypothetical protein